VDEAIFWQIIAEARRDADGDPEFMGEVLASRFSLDSPSKWLPIAGRNARMPL
jgi:hypothetical protein